MEELQVFYMENLGLTETFKTNLKHKVTKRQTMVRKMTVKKTMTYRSKFEKKNVCCALPLTIPDLQIHKRL